MSAGTVLMVAGLVVVLIGAALVLRARWQISPAVGAVTAGGPVDDLAEVTERLQAIYRSTDRALRTGVLVAVAGLVLAGIGAFLVSDTRAFGTSVGGTGTGGSPTGESW